MDRYSPSRILNSPTEYETPPGDRFIPNRSLMDFSRAQTLLTTKPVERNPNSPFDKEYRRRLEENLTLDSDGRPFRMLVFRGTPVSCRRSLCYIDGSVQQEKEQLLNNIKRSQRLPKNPDRVLDAPSLVDNFYMRHIDWGKNNVLAVALGTQVYLWTSEKPYPELLMQTDDENDYPTSVAWSQNAKTLAIGFKSSKLQLWDVHTSKLVRSLSGHQSRVGCLAWNDQLLTSGSKDRSIINHDVRARKTTLVRGHTNEVCGLKWSDGGNQLASGGNDNIIHIWEASKLQSRHFLHRLKDHQSAVKALAWCPHQYGTLASGGGSADKCIKLWNSHSGKCLQSIATTSQVCGLEWNKHHMELLSGHGYSENQLCLWSYPSMSKLADLKGHRSRILCLSQSPDGLSIASAGADQTIRIWKVFEPPEARKTDADSLLSLKRFHIR